MSKYNVVFAMSYETMASDENEALQIATDLFKEDTNLSESQIEIFGSNVEKIENE